MNYRGDVSQTWTSKKTGLSTPTLFVSPIFLVVKRGIAASGPKRPFPSEAIGVSFLELASWS